MTTKTITEAQLAASHPEDHCGRCGGPNPSWHAASPLWNAVMRTGEREPFDGIVCPSCFAFLAAEVGVTEHICLSTHDALVPLPTTFGDGRVWDAGLCRWVEAAALPADFWRALGKQQEWMNEPVQVQDDPVWKMTAKEGYLFDDAFWEVFERFPFRICHVSYSGAPWSQEGEPPEMVLRFTLALPDTGLELTTAVVNPLDVERLALALGSTVFDADLDPIQFYAERIAAEYARLTSSPTAEEEDPRPIYRVGGPI